MSNSLYMGVDVGTSGVRVAVIDEEGSELFEGRAAMTEFGTNHRSPYVWKDTTEAAVARALEGVEPKRIRAICVDGTSGTVLPVDASGSPMGEGLMYNDKVQDQTILDRINQCAPKDSAARGATSALSRAVALWRKTSGHILHQADWISGLFSGVWVSDENNALKTGYDLRNQCWPNWIDEVAAFRTALPQVFEPGSAIANVVPGAFGLTDETVVVSGTTDGCASFLATGACEPGDGVTSLGTTLTVKLLSEREVSSPKFGVYSHRLLGQWLAGGASNSGGAVLLKFFSQGDILELTQEIDPEEPSGLDYYPLTEPGERFPIADPFLEPRIAPRPKSDRRFLQGLLEGIAEIEGSAFERLSELGAPALRSIRTVGGGASNEAWQKIRLKRLGVDAMPSRSQNAAYGSALLAKRGVGC